MKNLNNIVLIGFMGTGKSTVGRRLAKTMGWSFVDTDNKIEEITGYSVSEIFRRYGETRFRSEEDLVVKRLSSKEKNVIATGGGTVINPENFNCLAQNGIIVQLYATIDAILQRVGTRPERPLLKGTREDIEKLWSERRKVYARADLTVDTTDKAIDEVVNEILTYVRDRGYRFGMAKD